MSSNVNFSGTRKAMSASECALESPGSILFDRICFEVIEYSLIDLQMKMLHTSILPKLGKNTKSKAEK